MSVLLSGRARAPLALVAAAACWGVGTVLTKQVVDDLAPLTLLPPQLAASCALLAVAGLVQGARVSWTPGMRRLALLGVLNPGVAYALGLIGLTTISASLSVLLWAAEPVLIAVAAWALLATASRRRWPRCWPRRWPASCWSSTSRARRARSSASR